MKCNKKILRILICLMFFVPTFNVILNYLNWYEDSGKIDSFKPKLALSGSISLNHGVSLTISGFSNSSIEWAYICSLSYINIEVRVLNSSQYNKHKKDNIHKEYFVLSNQSDHKNMGNFSVPYPDNWHLSFWNLDPAKKIVNLTFIVKFRNLYQNYPRDLKLLPLDLVAIGSFITIVSSLGGGIIIVIFLQKRNKKRMLESLQNSLNEGEVDFIE